jgi:hypothetical protein
MSEPDELARLRDHFAAAALTGLLARPDVDADPLEHHFCCEDAYQWADAMLRERANHIADASKMVQTPKETQGCHERFNAAVMNWISEATSVWAEACRSDGGRKIMQDACISCWDAYCPTNHEAAPAARASEATASPERVRARGDAGTGDTQEPVAWIVRTDHFQCGVAEHYETAVRWAEQTAGYIVPLYRQPQQGRDT